MKFGWAAKQNITFFPSITDTSILLQKSLGILSVLLDMVLFIDRRVFLLWNLLANLEIIYS